MNLLFVALLAAVLALALLALSYPLERDRVIRGARALRQTFGTPFVLALAGVCGLLVFACWWEHGWLAGLAASALILLAIRAHDLGELQERQQQEVDAAYDARPAGIGEDYGRLHRTQPSYGNPEL